MKSLHIVLLVAASALLSSAKPRGSDRPMCCQSKRCGGCACRSIKYSQAVEEALQAYLEENSEDYRKKLETPEEVLVNDVRKPETTEDANKYQPETDEGGGSSTRPYNGKIALKELLDIDFSEHFAGFDPMDCLLCKISHC